MNIHVYVCVTLIYWPSMSSYKLNWVECLSEETLFFEEFDFNLKLEKNLVINFKNFGQYNRAMSYNIE